MKIIGKVSLILLGVIILALIAMLITWTMKGLPSQLTVQDNYNARNATSSNQKTEYQQDLFTWGIYNFKYPRGWEVVQLTADVEVEGGGTHEYAVGLRIIPPGKDDDSKDVVTIGGYKVVDCDDAKGSTCTMGAVGTIAPNPVYTFSTDNTVLSAQKSIVSSFQINKR